MLKLIIFFIFSLNIFKLNEWHNLNIFFDFSDFTPGSVELKKLFTDNIFKIAKNYIHITFKVKEKQEVDLSKIDDFYSVYSLKKSYGNKIKGYDYVCKVVSVNQNNLTLGTASEIFLNSKSGRPNISLLEINVRHLKNYYDLNKRFIDYFFLIIHELFHGLGFNSEAINNNYDIKVEYNENKEQYIIKSPKVLEFARKHFNCPTLKNLNFENNSSIHWENTQLNSDVEIALKKNNKKISEITLAFFEDLGYYKINYNMGEILPWGLKKGCEFLNNPSDKFEEFGDDYQHDGCSLDYLGTASFRKTKLSNNLKLKNNRSTCSVENNKTNSCINLFEETECSKSKCILKDNVLSVQYDFWETKYICKKDNQIINDEYLKIKCPVIEKFCEYRYECKNQCSGRGYCLNGECICNGDYKGVACEFKKKIVNEYELNKKCNFNGYYNKDKCICYDNYSGVNCENIIIDKGSFGSKCKNSIYIKCYTGDYFKYIYKNKINESNSRRLF